MKKHLLILISLFALHLNQFAQKVEVSTSLSTSSDQKFQGSHGVGLGFSKEFNGEILIGLAGHYNFNSTNFDRVEQSDADFRVYYFSKITSCKVNRISLRLSAQIFLKNNENASLSVGLEGSINRFWGNAIADHIRYNDFFSSNTRNSFNYETINALGVGLISQAEVKNVFSPKLSICFTIRPELTNDSHLRFYSLEQDFRGINYFTEFQIGLKYKI